MCLNWETKAQTPVDNLIIFSCHTTLIFRGLVLNYTDHQPTPSLFFLSRGLGKAEAQPETYL